MATNKIILDTVEASMQSYQPQYAPVYGLLMGNSQSYGDVVGKVNFNQMDPMGDLNARRITPKDTEIFQLSVGPSSKSFKKYFLANQYTHSLLQEEGDVNSIVAKVLDHLQKQMDSLVLLGDGTAANNVINNGLYWSADPNYVLNTSEELRNAPDTQADFYDLMMENLAAPRELAGEKAIIVYGSTALAKLDSLVPDQIVPLKQLLGEGIDGAANVVRMPSAVTPSGANGWIIVNLAATKLHFTVMPTLKAQGVNEEKMYSWHNFLFGSAMVDVQAPGAVVRQPVTFEA